VQAQAAAEAWARDNDLVIAQAAQIEQLKAERAALVEALQELVEDSQSEFNQANFNLTVAESLGWQNMLERARAALAKAGGAL
jgi:Arc/MetJ family transcription regulator